MRGAVKPEDKILAPLTLASKFMWGVMPSIKVELTKLMECQLNSQQLYTEFTTFMINSSFGLAILSQANGDLLNTKLPSWVPDYNTEYKGSLLDRRSFDVTRFLCKEGGPYDRGKMIAPISYSEVELK
jgi:hypothetical protein